MEHIEHVDMLEMSEVMPDNRVIHNSNVERPNGWYYLKKEQGPLHRVLIVDKKFMILERYSFKGPEHEIPEETPYLIYYFNYVDNTIDREFPNIRPRHLFWPPTEELIAERKEFRKYWNLTMAGILSNSMQLEGNVESISNCKVCDKTIVNCIDGSKVYWCDADHRTENADHRSENADHRTENADHVAFINELSALMWMLLIVAIWHIMYWLEINAAVADGAMLTGCGVVLLRYGW